MKNSLFVLIVIIFLSINIKAQNISYELKQSAVFKDEFKNSNIQMVEDDGKGGVLVVRSYLGGMFSNSAGYYFEHYDSNLKLIKEYQLELKYSDFEKQGSVLGLITNNDEVHLINFLYNRNEKAYICSALSGKIEDFNFTKKELFRLKSEEIKSFSFFNSFSKGFDNDSGAQMIINEDKNAFAISVDIADTASETHKIFLFDNSLNKKIDHVFKREIKDKKFKYENIDVSKDGNTLYLLGKVKTEEQKKKKEGGKYQFELTRITKDSEKTQVFDTEEHFAASLKTIIIENRLTCVGFYSDKKDSRFKGVAYFELDPTTLDIKKSKYNPFTEQFILDKYGKENNKELKNLSFRKILINNNNEIIFNAEEFYVITQYITSPNGNYHRTSYHYDDIVTVKINPNGEIVWARNINKRQSTGGDNSFISYTSTVKGDDTYFFINSGEKVKKLKNDRIQFGQTSFKKSNLNIIKVNNNGDFDYQEILDDKDSEVPFMVSNGAITGNTIYFIGRKGSKKQLLKVTL